MGITPYPVRISNIFGNKEYAVDFYQREYKWNDDEKEFKPIKSLLDDIFYRFLLDYKPNLDIKPENISKYEWYYLNQFLTNEDRGKLFIVDGQQRLTTLTLIIIKLYHLGEKKFDANAEVLGFLRNSVCGYDMYGSKFWMGFPDRRSAIEDVFNNDLKINFTSAIAAAENISQRNIYRNYQVISNYLEDKLNTSHKFHHFRLYFFDRIFLLEAKIDKRKDVAMVFEVINDRGVPLKAYEILKGKILSPINTDDLDSYLPFWERNVKCIEDYDEQAVDDFFSFYFRGKYADTSEQFRRLETDKYHKSIFLDEFDSKIRLKHNETTSKHFVKEIIPYFAELYCDIWKYCQVYHKDYEAIYFNNLNEQERQFLLILSAIKYKDEDRDDKIKTVAWLFDRYYVILNLTNSYESKVFSESIIKLSYDIREKSLVDIKNAFDRHMLESINKAHSRGDITDFLKYELFENVGFTQLGKRFLRYFFARVEHFIAENSSLPCKDYYYLILQNRGSEDNIHHIEHILTNRDENLALFENEDEFNIQRNRLGAIVLLKGRDNESSNDELYVDKLRTYVGSGTLFAQTLIKDFYKSNIGLRDLTRKYGLDFKPYDTFDKTAINERQRLLFDVIKKIWGV